MIGKRTRLKSLPLPGREDEPVVRVSVIVAGVRYDVSYTNGSAGMNVSGDESRSFVHWVLVMFVRL